MTPRFLLVLIVVAAVEFVVVGRIILEFIMLGAVGGLLLGAVAGMICGLRCHKTLRGIRSGSVGGFFGGIVWAIVIGLILASLPKHQEHTEWGSRTVLMAEEIVVPISCLLFFGCSVCFGWIAAKQSLSLPKK